MSSLAPEWALYRSGAFVFPNKFKDENYHQEVLVQAAFYEDTVSGIFLEPGRSMINRSAGKSTCKSLFSSFLLIFFSKNYNFYLHFSVICC